MPRSRKQKEAAAVAEIAEKRWGFIKPEKRCPRCETVKVIEAFHRVNYRTSTGKISWHFESYCKECQRAKDRERYAKDPEKKIDYNRQRRSENPVYESGKQKRSRNRRSPEQIAKAKHLAFVSTIKRLYGVSLEEYKTHVAKHGSACACCGTSARVGIDHCHTSGKFRGLLCWGCNMALGNLKEDAKRARSLARYIETRCRTK